MPGTTDTVKTILTPGEFVIRKEAVDMIGVPMLNMINNMPEKGGHSNIDRLIEMATTENMKGMYGGGMVKAGPKPMGHGGMVDAYRGGGMVMDQYGHGGMVKDKMTMMEKGGQLKPVPEDNPGLGKLPEMVRNRMGYMQDGGEVGKSEAVFRDAIIASRQMPQDVTVNPETGLYDVSSIAGIAKDGGRQYYMGQGSGETYSDAAMMAHRMALRNSLSSDPMNISESELQSYFKPKRKGLRGLLGMQDGGEVSKLSKLLSMITPKGRRQKAYEELVPQDMLPVVEKASTLSDSFFYVPPEESGYIDLEEVERKNAIRRMLQGRPPQPQESKNDLTPFQEGGPVGPDPLQIDARQADPSMYGGSQLGVMDQAMMLQDSIEQDTVNKARKTLQLRN